MMKHILIAIATTLCAASALYADKKPKLTPAQIEERKYRHFGGYVVQPRETKVISIANEQGVVGDGALSGIAEEMQAMLTIPVVVDAKKDVGLVLKVREDDADVPLIVMPDNATAIVNVNALSADKPSQSVLETRICKELWRGLIYAIGGGNTYVQQCVMKQVSSLAGLDALPSKTACPDAFMRVAESAKALGIQPVRRVTYRQACKEGWAPEPTNDVQRAIWEETRKLPEKPIQIKFDPKKGR